MLFPLPYWHPELLQRGVSQQPKMIQDGRGVVVKLDMGDGTYLLQYHFSSASPSVYGLEGKYYTDAMPLGLQLIVSGGVAIVLGFLLMMGTWRGKG